MTPVYIAITVVCACCFAALAVLFVWFSNNKITVTGYAVKSRKAPETPLKIIHLSDLHGKSFGKENRRLIKSVRKEEPDFVVFTGDIIHKYREKDMRVALSLVRDLSALYPFYYVSGNHEMRNKGYSSFKKRLEEAGAVVLDNAVAEAGGIVLAGLNCAHLRNNTVYRLMPSGGKFKLLLAHEPQFFVTYARAGCDLVLCGHAHGGQWRIPFTRIGLFAPGQGLFPKYVSGRHFCGDTQMLISRGLGNSECPLRLFNRPEIVAITLSRDGEEK